VYIIEKIVLHCSDSPHGHGTGAEDIHEWHLARGWSGIGYHYVICEDGALERGRPHYWKGAHVVGHNRNSLGICLIGIDTFTDPQWSTLTDLLRSLKMLYPGVTIHGHYEFTNGKTCPNFNVKQFLKDYGI